MIAAGGGAFVQPENRALLADGALVVCLEARPETILQRLQASEAVSERPLLAAADPLGRIRELLAARRDSYARADAAIHTDALTPDEAAAEVVAIWRRYSAAMLASPGRLEAVAAGASTAGSYPDAACVVRAAGGTYPLYVEWGAIDRLGERLREAGLSGRVFLISDDHVFAAYGRQAEAAIEKAGLSVSSYVAPAGETSKSLEAAAAIYDWLAAERAERKHAIVALGGGVVTDLGGFVAATFARGLPLVHVPTSLLGMVDAAIGGKVAVNHREAKNLIGAFYQPRLVLADVAALRTLPARELTSGWAEVIKHAFIADEALLDALETQAEALIALDEGMATAVIKRSMAIKAEVVSQDEREETGLRTTLNYGHTLAHGLEAASGYAALLHGEAVAIGMMAAARISARLGLLDEAVVRRQQAVLKRFGLPTGGAAAGPRPGAGGYGPGQEGERRQYPLGAAGGNRQAGTTQ